MVKPTYHVDTLTALEIFAAIYFSIVLCIFMIEVYEVYELTFYSGVVYTESPESKQKEINLSKKKKKKKKFYKKIRN